MTASSNTAVIRQNCRWPILQSEQNHRSAADDFNFISGGVRVPSAGNRRISASGDGGRRGRTATEIVGRAVPGA